MRGLKQIVTGVTAVAAVVGVTGGVHAYSSYARWGSNSATFYVNPANADVSSAAAVSALQTAMDDWNTQSGSAFRFQYGGTASDTATAYDNRNVVLFRNSSNGSALATTYSWWNSSNQLLDADVVFWDGAFTFFTGTTGCSNGAYIEDVATHELGHALGLNHSSVVTATMYPSYSYCSQELRTLDADDISGAKSLYPGSSTPTNTAPSVSISSPTNGATFAEGASVAFSGAASDSQDGSLTSSLVWTDNGIAIGSGGAFSVTLAAGTHNVVARVTDSGGLQSSKSISLTVSSGTSSSGPSLTVRGRKAKGLQQADLFWSGLSASSVDVYRNGVKVFNTPDDGTQTDAINNKGGGSYSYRVCDAGTGNCSNTATVVF